MLKLHMGSCCIARNEGQQPRARGVMASCHYRNQNSIHIAEAACAQHDDRCVVSLLSISCRSS